ncbi:DgyrCDS8820 [Dimorphilus gyrociliatus]|uniref:DgyrCDS8820 n=1 Tax=Dimorphilus gyrociliatus TaxID=2664684 RepID=A0A7I8VWE2_9ANNE|nr:DgyrCDS8820 [Dimorphilus gyrociliatus]
MYVKEVRRKVLNISSGIDEPGAIKWDLALCLLLAWIVVYLCICKGIKSSGKVMYITAPAPYLFMFILLIRGATLPGSLEGVKFYIVPDWSKLKEIQVWVDAGTQIFFSYSISLGTLTALGSYNDFHHNVLKDSCLFALTNSGTSFLGGFVIFSVLGFMSHTHGIPIEHVAESGPGLAFIAYPKAIGEMPGSVVWSIFFFIMLILLGLDSQFVGVEGFVTAVVDQYPEKLRVGKRKEIFIAVICIISFFIGLSMVTRGGMYVFQLFDYYSGGRIVVLVAVFECVAIAHVYGVNRYWMNLEYMMGRRIQPLLKWFWFSVTPILDLTIFILACVTYSELTYNKTYTYPKWAIAIGWSLAALSVIMIPIVAIVKIISSEGSLMKRVAELTKPILKDHQKKLLDFPDNQQGYKENTV